VRDRALLTNGVSGNDWSALGSENLNVELAQRVISQDEPMQSL